MGGDPTVRLVGVKVRHSEPGLPAGSHSQIRVKLGFKQGRLPLVSALSSQRASCEDSEVLQSLVSTRWDPRTYDLAQDRFSQPPSWVTHLPADLRCSWLLGNGVGKGLLGGDWGPKQSI